MTSPKATAKADRRRIEGSASALVGVNDAYSTFAQATGTAAWFGSFQPGADRMIIKWEFLASSENSAYLVSVFGPGGTFDYYAQGFGDDVGLGLIPTTPSGSYQAQFQGVAGVPLRTFGSGPYPVSGWSSFTGTVDIQACRDSETKQIAFDLKDPFKRGGYSIELRVECGVGRFSVRRKMTGKPDGWIGICAYPEAGNRFDLLYNDGFRWVNYKMDGPNSPNPPLVADVYTYTPANDTLVTLHYTSPAAIQDLIAELKQAATQRRAPVLPAAPSRTFSPPPASVDELRGDAPGLASSPLR